MPLESRTTRQRSESRPHVKGHSLDHMSKGTHAVLHTIPVYFIYNTILFIKYYDIYHMFTYSLYAHAKFSYLVISEKYIHNLTQSDWVVRI